MIMFLIIFVWVFLFAIIIGTLAYVDSLRYDQLKKEEQIEKDLIDNGMEIHCCQQCQHTIAIHKEQLNGIKNVVTCPFCKKEVTISKDDVELKEALEYVERIRAFFEKNYGYFKEEYSSFDLGLDTRLISKKIETVGDLSVLQAISNEHFTKCNQIDVSNKVDAGVEIILDRDRQRDLEIIRNDKTI